MGKKINLFHKKIENKILLKVIAVYAVLALALTGLYYLEPTITGFTLYLVLGLAAVVLVSAFLMYEFMPRRKYHPKTKEDESKLIKTEQKIQKFEKELTALESAYNSKFISEASYRKDTERIGNELKKLRK